MSEALFDPLIHAPQRLRICAVLSGASHVEFGELCTRLDISKSALSKHLTVLVDGGYLREERVPRQGHSRLRLSLTERGGAAYAGHIEALRQIIGADA